MWKSLGLCALIAVLGCASTPPAPPVPRTAVDVNASFGKTWDAVIDVFAARNISIKTLDRASGLIVAERQAVAPDEARSLADCGTAFGVQVRAEAAFWNVLVRGDSTHATVRATVRFTEGGEGSRITSRETECSSRGGWESALEGRVKAAAEGKTASR